MNKDMETREPMNIDFEGMTENNSYYFDYAKDFDQMFTVEGMERFDSDSVMMF